MKILFLSWGVLPKKSGGLEKVTYYYFKYLDNFNHIVYLIIPEYTKEIEEFWKNKLKNSKIIGLNISFERFFPYSYSFNNIKRQSSLIKKNIDYKKAVFEYRDKLIKFLEEENIDFDVIYAYDWLTLPAAIEIKKRYNKPLVWHIHSTAYDRVGADENLLKYLIDHDYGIELEGCKIADKIIVVSKRMKDILIKYYNCDPSKIYVVYNAPDEEIIITKNLDEKEKFINKEKWNEIKKNYKIVLYLGRITKHKGPDILLKAARKVLDIRRDVLFIYAGDGEMKEQIIKMAADLKISRNIMFVGWIDDDEIIDFFYRISDVFVLPSVSEPFGLTPLEALKRRSAVIITKQAGVSEVLKNSAKIEFWDINKMADYILAFLEYPKLKEFEIKVCLNDIKNINWFNSSKNVEEILYSVIK